MPIRVFPVIGKATFVDDFNYVKPSGRVHHAIDIHANRGSRIVAVDDGVTHPHTDPMGGYVVDLHADDGVTYYLAHGQAMATVSGRVAAGDDLGFGVGTSGNAVGTDPHLHFASWRNGVPFDPYAELKAAQGVTVKSSPVSPWLIALGVIASAGLAAYVIRR